LEIIYEDYPNNNLIFKVLVAAGVIIRRNPETNEDELLLVQRSPVDKWALQWEIPRGKCDFMQKTGESEKILHCLKREIKEEVGLDIKPIKLIDTFEYSSKDRKRRAIQHNYLCKIIGSPQIKLSSEHINFKWVKSMSEVQLMLNTELVKVIAQVFNDEDKIINYPDEILPVEEKLNNYLGNL
jgi:8-oxo-dGTP pyrophosphatase MutT (NUDIX family)